MKKYHYIQIILVALQLCFLNVVSAPAQEADEVVSTRSNYQMLLTRLKIYMDYYLVTDEVRALQSESMQYGQEGEYEIANVLLEEAIERLTLSTDKDSTLSFASFSPEVIGQSQNFRFGMMSGIDYNRQEFEVGFSGSDSTLHEEFNKPYLGLFAGYILNLSQQTSLEFFNAFRYDRENLRNDYRIRWQVGNSIYMQYAGYWNHSQIEELYSYWEHVVSAKIGSTIGPNFFWTFYNIFNYKTYQSGPFFIKDYYRNRFNAMIEWRLDFFGFVGIEYGNERNETLSFDDNDYDQHHFRAGIRSENIDPFYHNIFVDVSLRDYSLLLTDSLISNTVEAYAFEFIYEVSLISMFIVTIEDNFLYKIYHKKSSIEPDYYWNILRPGIKLRTSIGFEIGGGYEWEIKEHKNNPSDSYNVSEQNYRADGIFGHINYFSVNGTYLSASVSYQWRRYPSSITNDLFSLYSNRNIFSTMIMAYIPLFEQLNLNAFISYDNDLDIDFDQQNNQSTIFSVELEYVF
jgi:hypothetical protein